jgi:hypothetical protein
MRTFPGLAALAPLVLAGCFSPELPATISCGVDGTCPPGLRCETTANICVDPNQAGVAELHSETQPASVEAGVDAPEIVVQLRDASGKIVPVTGGTFAVELADKAAGVNLLGTVIHPAVQGVVTFDKLRFDHPAGGMRLVVRGGEVAATSAAFDVLTTRPSVLGISVGGIVDSCATVTYQLQQAQSLPVDVLVEFDPDGAEGPLPFRRATQAGSDPGKAGVDHVPGSPEGRALTFTWDTTADVGAFDVTGRLRITPSVGGVAGIASEQTVTVRNGARFFAFVHGVPEGIRHVIDDNRSGLFTFGAVNQGLHAIQFGSMELFPVPDGASVADFALGDFDGDARYDQIVGLSTGTVVKHQLRSGGGHMGPDEPMALHFLKLVTDDLDHDGLDDAIGVEAGSGDVVILRATREAPGALVEALRPWHGGAANVKLADLDHDGWKDLVVARASATAPIGVVRGSATGFAAPTTLALTGGVVDVADLDLDGRDDVVSLDAAGLHVAASSAGRVDLAAITGTALGIHDVNGDRLPDVVVARGDSIFLYPHAPARHVVAFMPVTRVGTAPETTDLIVGEYGDYRSTIFALANGGPEPPGTVVRFDNRMPRRCAPRLAAPLISGQNMQFGTAMGDVNVDGKVDRISFASGSGDHGAIVASLGRGDGTFEAAGPSLYEWAPSGQARSLVVADLDRDGRSDIAFLDGDSRAITILYNDRGSPGTFTHVELPIQVAEGLAVADLDGDGAQDLVILDAGHVNIRRGDPDARSFGHPTVLPTPFDTGDASSFCREGCDAYVADLDADGRLDIVVQALGALYAYRADPLAAVGYDEPVVVEIGVNVWMERLIDLNEDGRLEALVDLPTTGTEPVQLTGFQLNPAATAFEPVWSLILPIGRSAAVDVDIDGDGAKETIFRANDEFWQLVPGPQPEARSLPWGAFELGYGSAVADVNSDGHDDLIAATVGGTTVIRFGEHGPIDLGTLLTPRGKGEGGGFGNQVAIGDFDGDELPDLAIRDSADRQIILKRQSSDAPGTLAADEVAVTGYYSSALADVDGDRRADLVTYGENESLFYLDPAAPATYGRCVSDFPSFPYAVGDVDRDGRPDIVEATWTDVVLRRDPADACAAPVTIMGLDAAPGATWRPNALALADLNQDGFLDIVIATDAVRVALQDPDAPGHFAVTDYEADTRTDFPPFWDFVVADVNSDHMLDVVVIDSSYRVRAFLGTFDAPGVLRPSMVLVEDNGRYGRTSLSVGELDDDGRTDIVVGGNRYNEVFLQQPRLHPEVAGSPATFAFAYATTSSRLDQFDAERATVVDFDRDGKDDLIYVDPTVGTMLVKGR